MLYFVTRGLCMANARLELRDGDRWPQPDGLITLIDRPIICREMDTVKIKHVFAGIL